MVDVCVDSPRGVLKPLGALFGVSLFCVLACVVLQRLSSSRVRSRCAMVASSKVSVRRRFCSSSESLDCWLTTSFSSSAARITFAARLTQSLASAASSTACAASPAVRASSTRLSALRAFAAGSRTRALRSVEVSRAFRRCSMDAGSLSSASARGLANSPVASKGQPKRKRR